MLYSFWSCFHTLSTGRHLNLPNPCASRDGLKKVQKHGSDENTNTILLQKSRGNERLEDYSTSVAKIKSGNRSKSSSFSLPRLFCSSIVLCFYLFLVLSFFQSHPYLHLIFTENVTPSLFLFWLLGSKLIKRHGSTSSGNFNNSIND